MPCLFFGSIYFSFTHKLSEEEFHDREKKDETQGRDKGGKGEGKRQEMVGCLLPSSRQMVVWLPLSCQLANKDDGEIWGKIIEKKKERWASLLFLLLHPITLFLLPASAVFKWVITALKDQANAIFNLLLPNKKRETLQK